MSDRILDAIGTKMISKWRQEALDSGMDRKYAHRNAVDRWHNTQHEFEDYIADVLLHMLEKDQFIQRLSGDVTD